MYLSRRSFMQAAAVAIAGAAVAAEDAAEPLPIIDTHQHLWDLKKFNLPWVRRGDPLLDRDFLTEDYREATRGLNVVKAIYMEVAVDPAQRLAEAEWVTELCRRGETPTVAAVIGGSPESPDFAGYIDRFEDSPHIKGVRQGFKRGSSGNEPFIAGLRLLGGREMSFDLLGGSSTFAEMAKVVDACPETRFVLDHCGNPDLRLFDQREQDVRLVAKRLQWQDGISELAARKNVVCKISGIVEGAALMPTAERAAPVINHCLDAFGPDRVMFSSNWPVCLRTATLAEWVRLLRQVIQERPREEQRKLFHDNAVRFYGLA